MMPALSHYRLRLAGLFALLCALVVALVGFGGSPQAPLPEPQTVGPVTGFTVSAEGQPSGTLRLTWNAAENAQVHFVYYIDKENLDARNWAAGQMRAFNGTEATLDGLASGKTYSFAIRGMRWNFDPFGAVWGDWFYWETATPTAESTGEYSASQLETLFDEIISKTEEREAFSEVKERNVWFSAIADMKKLRSEFVSSKSGEELYWALVKLSNARRDRHLVIREVPGGLPFPQPRPCVSAPISVLPDYSGSGNPTFVVAQTFEGQTEPAIGDVIVGVNGRYIAEYVDEFTPWYRHSTLHGLHWRMARDLPRQRDYVPPNLYSKRLDLTLERPSGQRYDVSLPYRDGCYGLGFSAFYPGFDVVMQRENFNVYLDRSRQIVLLQWLDFEYSLIQDIPDLMDYAEREELLDYDMIIDVTWSGGGSRGAYAIQRLVDEPFRVTFGNVRLSDLGKERIQRYADSEPDTSQPDIFGLNLSRSWLYEWARTDAMESIRRGDEYTPAVPFKLAHLPKDSDGILQPAPVHFSGEVAIINARTSGGSHLDQFVTMFVDNDLATFIGMPTGGFSNTWEGYEVLYFSDTGQPVVEFMWSIGHTIRPNGEILEGNPAQPDVYMPLTRDNFQDYHQTLLDTAIATLNSQP